MRFVSKSSNLLVVLRPGLSAQPLVGQAAKPTISVRFKDGVADVQQEELEKMMLAHPGFNQDFIVVDPAGRDPYASSRTATESRVITKIIHGTPGERIITGEKTLPPELQKLISESAVAMAKEMLPGMIEVALKNLVSDHEKNKSKLTGKPRGRPGRKSSVANLVPQKLEPEVVVPVDGAPVAPIGASESSVSNA